jgi:hypothetical protein
MFYIYWESKFTGHKIWTITPHISPDHSEFVQHATGDEFNIQLICQPSNRPDMNILDFGYFQAIQTVYYSINPLDNLLMTYLVIR